MSTQAAQRKTIHIHLGPHKTGSTAIQHALNAHGDLIERDLGLTPVTNRPVRDLAQAMAREDDVAIEAALSTLVAQCAKARGDVVISCEDFAGDLPGRSGKRRAYPRLWQNVNILRKGFTGCDLRFYFFLRDREKWLRSAYIQLLKHRQKFRSFDGYISFLNDAEGLWDQPLNKCRQKLGKHLIEIDYVEGSDFSASRALFEAIAPGVSLDLPADDRRPNTSPDEKTVAMLEQINGSGASIHAVQLAKKTILGITVAPLSAPETVDFPDWPANLSRPGWLSKDLEGLWSRTNARAKHQDQLNLMPPLDCDLKILRCRLVEADDEFPQGGRHHMENQVRILAYRFRGKPEICFLLGLTISYLRRNTDHTAHAAALFQRLWAEEYALLLGVLPTRWLISTFQTFMDHGANDVQRMIGSSAFFLSNTLKLYEAERALDGLEPDTTYPSTTPTTKSGFVGLDRFRVGGTDLMINTNALLLEIASRDDIAGRVVQEFILRMKQSHTAFSRMDQSRIAHNVDIPQFANCWSFFDPPKS